MTNIERLEAKLNALKEAKNEFNGKVGACIATFKSISIEYASKAETADKSTRATLTALVKKLDKAIATLEKVGA